MAAIKSKTICPLCKEMISNNNISKHTKKCLEMLDKTKLPKGFKKGNSAWNKGKTKETDIRVSMNGKAVSDRIQEKIKSGTFSANKMGAAARERLSEIQSLHNRGGKCKWYEVAGQSVQGTYEKKFAESLELAGIDWVKVKTHNHIFKYEKKGKISSYAPDFYIPSMNLYVEIKGYWGSGDRIKMECVRSQHSDKKLVVIFGFEKLKQICIDIKKLLPLEPVWLW